MVSIKKSVRAAVDGVVVRTRNAGFSIRDMQREIAAAGQKARSEIEAIRADIEREEQRLAVIERAPASADEVAARVDEFIAQAANDARGGTFFDIVATPSGRYSSNAVWSALDHQTLAGMLSVVYPDRLRTAMISEAERAAKELDAPAMSTSQRNKALAEAKLSIRALVAREELCARALDGAGLRVERRHGVPRDVVDAGVEQLERWADE